MKGEMWNHDIRLRKDVNVANGRYTFVYMEGQNYVSFVTCKEKLDVYVHNRLLCTIDTDVPLTSQTWMVKHPTTGCTRTIVEKDFPPKDTDLLCTKLRWCDVSYRPFSPNSMDFYLSIRPKQTVVQSR
jgi:hypothetical protein